MSAGSCAVSPPKYPRIGWAKDRPNVIEFALPILIPGGAVYLYKKSPHPVPIDDVLAGKPADLFTGTACTPAGRICTSMRGTLLIIVIKDAPADACMIRQKFARHVARGEDTPVLAFPNQAHCWGVSP